ncbi:MAG: hybrid sensor histidine kinase/response regulator [Deferribacteres bacterium]|nr:hybrid sensor histidine kinase/response regulator [candidate division KSB1 bacterium]MCB9501675.1 hybrid sensor histidine kinase/response regulator [Deferribacteres bacterium]
MKTLILQRDPDYAQLLQNRLGKDTRIVYPTEKTNPKNLNLESFDLIFVDDTIDIGTLYSYFRESDKKQSPAVIFLLDPDNAESALQPAFTGFSGIMPRTKDILDFLPLFIKHARYNSKQKQRINLLNRQLEEADKAAFIGRISAGLAHDFNNILHLISGHAFAAQELDSTEAKNASLEIIRDCSDQGKNIANQLNNLLRPKTFQQSNLPIASIILTALQFMQYEFNRAKIDVEKHFQEDLRVVCNEEQILQTFLNILANIRDNLYATGGKLAITTYENDGNAVVEFADTGTGIDESLHSKIFDPHFTTKRRNANSKEFGGSGMGLYISKNIVEQHNGKIEVQNRTGGGSIFSISLPSAPAPEDMLLRPRSTNTLVDMPDPENLDILVVEDEEMIRTVLKNLLTMEGHKVTVVDSGKSALDHVKDFEYDIVLSDLNMPQMNGLDFLRQAKKLKNDIKVVMITGDHYSQELEMAEQEGSAGSLLKPFNKKQLDTLIQKVSFESK